jgi:hypothetical protein
VVGRSGQLSGDEVGKPYAHACVRALVRVQLRMQEWVEGKGGNQSRGVRFFVLF